MHDFEAVCDPIDAAEQFALTHARAGRARKMQNNLRLDARFRQTLYSESVIHGCEIGDRAVEHEKLSAGPEQASLQTPTTRYASPRHGFRLTPKTPKRIAASP